MSEQIKAQLSELAIFQALAHSAGERAAQMALKLKQVPELNQAEVQQQDPVAV
jgi:hypothetical protein